MAGNGESSMRVRGAPLGCEDSVQVNLDADGQGALIDRYFYLAGRLMGQKVRFPGFKGTIPTIWKMRKGLSIHDAGDRFIFQFDRVTD